MAAAAAAAGCGPKGLTAAAADRAAVCYCCCCWWVLLLLLLGSPCHGGSCGMLSSSVLAVLGVSSCIPAGTGQRNVEGRHSTRQATDEDVSMGQIKDMVACDAVACRVRCSWLRWGGP